VQNQIGKENEAQEDGVPDSDEEQPVVVRPTKRKKARRVVVTEMSSEDSDVEIVIPKTKRNQPESPRKIAYERSVKKMFEYQ
jgi:hypothetical protein